MCTERQSILHGVRQGQLAVFNLRPALEIRVPKTGNVREGAGLQTGIRLQGLGLPGAVRHDEYRGDGDVIRQFAGQLRREFLADRLPVLIRLRQDGFAVGVAAVVH